ncbi:MAG: hypothetical protein E3J64_08465 [Anaerolineales bacterium]|nr:MAG: hypothetical protein E3J64_08465 [Anaerolineales bacterium]
MAGSTGRRKKRRKLTRPEKAIVALSALVLVLGLANLGRAAGALAGGSALPDLPLSVSWTYLAVTGLVWGLAFLVCAGGLIWFRRWSRWATIAAVTAYEIQVWVNHLLFDRSDRALQTRGWDLLLAVLLLIVTWGLLNRPKVRGVFSE